jgi:hypothetical protein
VLQYKCNEQFRDVRPVATTARFVLWKVLKELVAGEVGRYAENEERRTVFYADDVYRYACHDDFLQSSHGGWLHESSDLWLLAA